MAVWGVEVQPHTWHKISVEDFKNLYITQVTIGEVLNRDIADTKKFTVNMRVNGKVMVIATLHPVHEPQSSFLNLFVDQDIELSHRWKNGSVNFCGCIRESPIINDQYEFGTGASLPQGKPSSILSRLYHIENDTSHCSTLVRKYAREWRHGEKKCREKCLYVKNLSFSTTKYDLITYFSSFGAVEDVSMSTREDGAFMRSALVRMGTLDGIKRIGEHRTHSLRGKHMDIVKFQGWRVHEREWVDGEYILKLEGLKLLDCDQSKMKGKVEVSNHLIAQVEKAFDGFTYTTIHLETDRRYEYTGCAKVRFPNQDGVLRRVRKVLGCEAEWIKQNPDVILYENEED